MKMRYSFLQVVWKATKSVGCARKDCSGGWSYLLCDYLPPGNVIGLFAQNVFKPRSQ